MKFINNFYQIWLFIGIILVDLISKYIFKNYFGEGEINLIFDLLYIKYVQNDGIAFSIDLPFLKIFTVIFIILIFLFYYHYEKKKHNFFIDLSFTLILAGAIGNAIERLAFSRVTDFIGVKHFAVFNLADSFITIGVIIYIILIILKKDTNYDKINKN